MTIGGPTIKLSNGLEMPAVGLGTWQSSPSEVKAAVKAAIHAGYRLIDTAEVYQNEEAIGEAIQELIAENVITREQLFITTKVWTTHYTPEAVETAIKTSLEKLKTTYVDLYLAHMPAAFNPDFSHKTGVSVEQLWEALEGVYNKKYAKAIGVSNWNNEQVDRAIKSGTVPIHNSQVELHLYFPQHEHVNFCKKHGITVTSYATLGSPGRVNFKLPTGELLDWAPAPSDLEDANVKTLAQKYNKTPAQVLLRYALQRGIAIIPKSINPTRIVENFNVFDFELTKEEIATLESSGNVHRLFLQDFMIGHPEDPFKNERK